MAIRFYGAKRDTPDDRDFMNKVYEEIPDEDEWSYVDLCEGVKMVYDQGTLQSCTANAVCAAYGLDLLIEQELGLNRVRRGCSDPSRLFLYYNTREHLGTTLENSGASIRDTVKALNCYGVCKNLYWPYNIRTFMRRPYLFSYNTAEGKGLCLYERLSQDINQFRASLKFGYPFVFGFEVYESFHSAQQKGVVPMPTIVERREQPEGLHAALAVGYNDSQQVIKVLNSWGHGWGDGGYFYMPYQFITDSSLCFDFWKISYRI